MPAGGLAVAGVGALVGAGETIWGASQKKKYQNQLNALSSQRPQYQIPQTEYDIQNLAENQANQGMGAGARQQLQNNTDRQLATLSNSALMGGADANTIGGIVDKTQQGYNQNAIYDDQVRLQNLNNLQSAYARMSANRDKEWDFNDYQPWKDRMTALNQQLTGANNMFTSGLNMLGSGLMSGGMKAFSQGGNNYGNPGGSNYTSIAPTYTSSPALFSAGPPSSPGEMGYAQIPKM